MVVQWVIFMPLILPLSIVAGIYEGIKRTVHQAQADIFQKEEVA